MTGQNQKRMMYKKPWRMLQPAVPTSKPMKIKEKSPCLQVTLKTVKNGHTVKNNVSGFLLKTIIRTIGFEVFNHNSLVNYSSLVCNASTYLGKII